MPYLEADVQVILRLHGGAADKSVNLKSKNTSDRGMRQVDHVVATLATLPNKVGITYAALAGPDELECRRAILPVVQGLGGPAHPYDLVTPPEKSGHYFNGTVWTGGNGHAYVVVYDNGDPGGPIVFDGLGGGGEAASIDYLVAVSWP